MKSLIKKIIIIILIIIPEIALTQMQLDWVKRYHGAYNGMDVANSVAVDDSGNVLVTGGVQSNSGYICTTFKYDKTGILKWTKDYTPSYWCIGKDIICDDSGNVYVANSSSVIKYNNSGLLMWEYNDTTDYGKIILDSNVNLYCGGSKSGKFVATKLNIFGQRLWRTQQFGGDRFKDMVLDKSGSVSITGVAQSGTTFYDYYTIKYSNDGIILWRKAYSGRAVYPSDDFVYSIASDNMNNVYVTGSSMDSLSTFNCLTVKYDSFGNEVWIKRIYPPSNGYDIKVDEFQNVYIAARSNGNNYAIKMDMNANIIWQRTYPCTYIFAVNLSRLMLDSANNVYTTINYDSNGNTHYGAIKYNNNGDQIYNVSYIYNPISYDYSQDLFIDKKGSLYITGESSRAYGTVKFSPIITNLIENNLYVSDYKLEQNYPNPFNPNTKINYELKIANYVSVIVFDVLGNEIKSLVNKKQTAGKYEVELDGKDLPSGIYFYSLSIDGNVIDTKRMILLK